MAKKQPPAQQNYTNDEHWGKGGRFVVDPRTGKRVPADQYQPEQVDKPNAVEVSND